MDLEPLPAVILAIAEQRSLAAVLKTIIDAVARQPGVALARLWLRQADESCPICRSRMPSLEPALHLRASAGAPLSEAADWTRSDGTFHRIPLTPGNLKIAHIATTGESIRIAPLADDHQWVRHPAWAQKEGLASFAGHALIFRGEPLGVLAVFRRTSADDDCFNWLRTMASAAAVAIANARAFEDNEFLRRELELERDYLREEAAERSARSSAAAPHWSAYCIRWRWSRRPMPTYWCREKAARGRNSSPAPSIRPALDPASPS